VNISTLRRIKRCWLAATIGIVSWFGWFALNYDVPDYRLVFGFALLAVSFPIGLLVGDAIGFATHNFLSGMSVQWYRDYATAWIVGQGVLFIGAGYFQWFCLVPFVVRILRRLGTGSPRD